MLLQLGPSCELGIAEITRPHHDRHSISRSTAVKRHVCLEVVALRKRPVADGADEGSFSRVRPRVSAQVRLLAERPTAKLAAEWTLAAMSPQVHRQHAVVCESVATHDARKPAPCVVVVVGFVAPHVLVEVATLCERAVTLRADVRTFSSVKANVSLQVTVLSKTALTSVAHKRTFTAVNALMSLQVRRLHTHTHSNLPSQPQVLSPDIQKKNLWAKWQRPGARFTKYLRINLG